jgi:multiple sugar transport system ATP-binding protein
MAFLKLINLTKRYGKYTAVNRVNLDVNKGEFLVILGPSGSGKSTILRLIAGLEDPDEGDIILDGVKINDIDPKDRDIAMVFQSYAIYPHMTVYQNIEFPLKMRKTPSEERKRKVKEVAELLGISHLLEKKAWQLSGGEQQRVALARALVRNPKLFLLDEPLSNLDAKLRVKLRFELRKLLHDELKITTIYVTHDQAEAMTMADRIAIINEGKIIQVDTPLNIYNKPRNTFIATFIGTPPMNLLPGTLKDVHLLIMGDFKLRLNKPLDLHGSVFIGIRPQHFEISKCEPGIKGRVTSYEYLGDDVIIHIDITDLDVQVLMPSRDLRDLVINQEIYLRPVDKIYIFDELSRDLVNIIEPNEYSHNYT